MKKLFSSLYFFLLIHGLVLSQPQKEIDSLTYVLEQQAFEAEQGGSKEKLQETLFTIANNYFELDDYENAFIFYNKCLKSNIKMELEDKAKILYNLGKAKFKQNQIDSAQFYFDKSSNVYDIIGDKKLIIRHLFEVGNLYSKKGHLQKGLNLTYKALQISEEIIDTFILVALYTQIGELHKIQGDLDAAIVYQKKAISTVELFDNFTQAMAMQKHRLANILIENKDYEEAIQNSKEAIALLKTYNYSSHKIIFYTTLSKAFKEFQQIDSAFHYINQIASIIDENQPPFVNAPAYLELGQINQLFNQNYSPLSSYEKALFYANKTSDRDIIVKASKLLYPLYQQNGAYEKAYNTLQLYQTNKDSLFNINNTRSIVQKEMAYAHEKEQEIAEFKQQQVLDRQRWFTYSAILSSLFLIGIAGSIYRNNRNKKRANDLLTIQNEEIIKQKAELEQMDLMKSKFFANISHELRTPLTLISSPIEQILQKDEKSPLSSSKSELQLMQRNTKQLKSLVNDIMDLTKLESKKINLYDEEVALVPFLNRTSNNFESLAKHLNIELKNHIEFGDDTYLNFDAGKVEKIINNLMSNAIKNTPSKGQVIVRAHKNNGQLNIGVTDTGKGISQEDLPHIFDRYFQSKSAHSALQGGTGIGLALARELTKLMNGTLTVESELGKGSQFLLSLPYKKVKEPKIKFQANKIALPVEKYSEPLEKTISPTDKKHHILIVEDNIDMQHFIRLLLNDHYHTHVANHGIQALKILKTTNVDLIVSDIMMPEMDGYTLLHNIKTHDNYKKIPIIMLTALDSHDKKLKALTLGVDDYLSKPFSPDELMARAFNLIERFEIRQSIQDDITTKIEAQKTVLHKADTEIIINDSTTQPEDEWLQKVEQTVREQIENPDFKISDLASQFFLSDRQFRRRMNQLTGLSPKKYQREVGLQYARELLEQRKYGSVKAVSFTVGMSNVWRFSQLYEARFGKKPSAYF